MVAGYMHANVLCGIFSSVGISMWPSYEIKLNPREHCIGNLLESTCKLFYFIGHLYIRSSHITDFNLSNYGGGGGRKKLPFKGYKSASFYI